MAASLIAPVEQVDPLVGADPVELQLDMVNAIEKAQSKCLQLSRIVWYRRIEPQATPRENTFRTLGIFAYKIRDPDISSSIR